MYTYLCVCIHTHIHTCIHTHLVYIGDTDIDISIYMHITSPTYTQQGKMSDIEYNISGHAKKQENMTHN